MKIAQVAPLAESVPPRAYGGTERVVHYLVEELVRRGQEVTLFAAGDSLTSARLVPIVKKALRHDSGVQDPVLHNIRLIEAVRQRAHEFDVIHFHIDALHFPTFRPMAGKTVTTLHGRLDLPDLVPLHREFIEMPLVSISDAQRAPLAFANWQATIHHGLPHDVAPFHPRRGNYLAFLGRFAPEKRPDRAIEIAKRVGIPLKMAAKVDRADADYFEQRIRPMLDHPLIDWIGEIGEGDKPAFLGNALALLFPIDWPEPFGLAMIEAMACGTPVIACRSGSVPEVIEHGVSGLIVDSEDDAVQATAHVGELDRRAVRAAFDRRFRAERMADEYLRLYARLVQPRGPARNKIVWQRPAAVAHVGYRPWT